MNTPEHDVGGVVLIGGRSRRMGQPKHALPFGRVTVLETVIATLHQVVSQVVVVKAAGQPLPKLPDDVIVAEDEVPDRGPLAGIAAGLNSLKGKCRAAFVTSCDVPLLKPAVVRAMIGALDSHELCVPRDREYVHVLAGVYSVGLVERIREMISAGQLRTMSLIGESDAKIIDVKELRPVDPDLLSFRNVNTPDDYTEALRLFESYDL